MPSSAIQPGFFIPSLDELLDVTVPSPTIGDVLQFNGSEWANVPGSFVSSLNDLSDVTLTAPATDNVFQFDGFQWINRDSLQLDQSNGNLFFGERDTDDTWRMRRDYDDTLLRLVIERRSGTYSEQISIENGILRVFGSGGGGGVIVMDDEVRVYNPSHAFYVGNDDGDNSWRIGRNGGSLTIDDFSLAFNGTNQFSLTSTGDAEVVGEIAANSFQVTAVVSAGFVKNDASGNFSFGETGGSGTGTSIRETITQTAHGFVAGNVLTHNTTLWIKAKADDATTADALGVVESVTANDFVIVYAGVITITAAFTAGSMHFLSTTTAGAFTTTEPSVGSIVKPVLYGITTGIANVVIQRGIRVSSAQPSITAVKKTTDQTFVATTTLANATDLSFSVISGHYYKFEFDVLFQSNTSTTGLKVSVTTPTFTRFGAAVSIPIAGDGVDAQFEGDITSSGDAVSGTDVAATGTDYVAHIEGVIFPSASGTVQVQAACEVAAGTITVRQGSVGLLYDMGV